MTSFWILAIVSFVFFVFYLISMFREARKNQRESMKHTVEELKSRTVRDLKTVEQLRAVDDLLALKFVELQFRREIDRIDARGKFFISFLKNAGPAVFALGFLLGVVDFTSATPNINTLPAIYLTTFGAVIVVMLAFIEPAFQVPIDRLKKGLTLLEQAQITE
jgi:Ca2+/Na+ antiporter